MKICPKCKTEFQTGQQFCKNCGCNLKECYIENPICPVCNTVYESGTLFCQKDGNRLTSSDKLIPKCTICGALYDTTTKFCPKDGGVVVAEALRDIKSNNFEPYSLAKASIGLRFIASLIDSIVMSALAIPAIILYSLGMAELGKYDYENKAAIFFILALVLYIFPTTYSLIKDGLYKGQSVGKKVVGLRVINLSNNSPCSISVSCLRNIIGGIIGVIPIVGWLIEPIMVLATDKGRRIADKVANTQVVNIK